MIWKGLIAISIIAIIIGGIVWVAEGSHIYTKDREKVVKVVKDELFGTEHEEITWKENFQLGLLPDSSDLVHAYRSLVFIVGVAGGVIVFSTIMIRRGRSNQ